MNNSEFPEAKVSGSKDSFKKMIQQNQKIKDL